MIAATVSIFIMFTQLTLHQVILFPVNIKNICVWEYLLM